MNNFRNNYTRYNNNSNHRNNSNQAAYEKHDKTMATDANADANETEDTGSPSPSDDSLKTMEGNEEKQNNGSSSGNSAQNNNWKNDPSLKNMDLKKLAFLSELASQSGNQSMDSLLPFLISANKNANSMGLQFNDTETDLILNVLKSRMSPEEQSRIDMIRQMADLLGRKG